jgi:thiamine pyrophosphokinase
MDYVIILNGDKPALPPNLFKGKRVICADGAYSYAAEMDIEVELLIGDMDSIKYVPKTVNITRFSSDKDATDGQLALDEAIRRGAKDITIIGASGGRDDHYMGNLILLYRALKKGVSARIITDHCDIFMFDKSVRFPVKKNYYLSIVPFGGLLHIMNTEGLKYRICDKVLMLDETLGISNVTTAGSVYIEVKSGCGIAYVTHEQI